MRYLLTALVLAAPLSSGAAPSNVCSVSDIIDCKALAKGPVDLSGTQGFPKFKDGRQIFNVLAGLSQQDSPEFAQSQEPTPKQLKDLDKNAVRIKERIRGYLKAGRSEDWIKNSKEAEAVELRALLKRLDAIKIRVSNEDDFECSIETPTGFPNALNEPLRNTIMLCPPSARQSLPWLTRTIAHELGHALGPCAMDLSLYKAKSNDDLAAGNCFQNGEDSENLDVDREVTRLIKSVRSGEVTSIVTTRSRASEVLTCGLFEEVPDASIPKERRKIFDRAPKCIDKLYASEYEALIQKGVEQDLYTGMKDTKLAESRRRSENPQTCYSRANEHFADSFAARFTAHVAEEDNWGKNEVRISLMNDALALCAAQANQPFLPPHRYPSAATRLSVALNEDVIRDKLNCVAEPNADKLCSLPTAQQSSPQQTQKPSQRSNRKNSNSSPSVQ